MYLICPKQSLKKLGQSMRLSFNDYPWSHASLDYRLKSQDPTSSGQNQKKKKNDNVLRRVIIERECRPQRGGPDLACHSATWDKRERKCYLHSYLLMTLIFPSNREEMYPQSMFQELSSQVLHFFLERLKRDIKEDQPLLESCRLYI